VRRLTFCSDATKSQQKQDIIGILSAGDVSVDSRMLKNTLEKIAD